jgi:hypothetical protein
MMLAEIGDEINPERRNRTYPRVVKRKMSNFPVERARHRQQRRDNRPSHSAVVITPPSKTGHRRRPSARGQNQLATNASYRGLGR